MISVLAGFVVGFMIMLAVRAFLESWWKREEGRLPEKERNKDVNS